MVTINDSEKFKAKDHEAHPTATAYLSMRDLDDLTT
jgi:hypothetical protein